MGGSKSDADSRAHRYVKSADNAVSIEGKVLRVIRDMHDTRTWSSTWSSAAERFAKNATLASMNAPP